MASSFNLGTLAAVSSATGGSVPPSSSLAESAGASPPSAGGHIAVEESTLKTLRQDLANLIKIWYAHVRAGQPGNFKQLLWGRNGRWQPVWDIAHKEITSVGGDNCRELQRLLAAITSEHGGDSKTVTRTCTQVLSQVVHMENKHRGPYKNDEEVLDSISPAGTLPGTPEPTDSAAEKPDFTWPDGRKWKGQVTKDYKGQVTKDSRPIGYGTITNTDGSSERLDSCDSEGRDLNRKCFVKNGKPGFLKFFAMAGSNQGKYELQYQNDASDKPEYVSAADAYPLYAAGCEYEQQTKEARQREVAEAAAEKVDDNVLVPYSGSDEEQQHTVTDYLGTSGVTKCAPPSDADDIQQKAQKLLKKA